MHTIGRKATLWIFYMNISIHGTQVVPAAQHAPETDSNILTKLPNSTGNRQMRGFNQYGVMYRVVFENYGYQRLMIMIVNCVLSSVSVEPIQAGIS